MPTKKFRFTLIPRAEALAHEDIIIGITDFVAKEETIPKCLPNPDKQRVGGITLFGMTRLIRFLPQNFDLTIGKATTETVKSQHS